ncbi:hypothetical protein [Corynebacterium epidermidicanis]|uniref:Uncharacterized protein n=1 Tax=Corynebacterium epidermidicanis TaxID=1050174 RepID=A0A0G3GR62_9CORY|nr:hypothetical protein [Corynebacterium epidermidicanis]AKK03075.1 hypothetical protein CEPID_06070 [Corynebacterium epidermidicanis]
MTRRLESAYTLQQWKQLEKDVFGTVTIEGVKYEPGAALTTLKSSTRECTLSPIASLCIAIMNVCAAVPPGTTFNAGLGPGSLNQILVLVGGPGAHKDRHASQVANALKITHDDIPVEIRRHSPGSGEGLVAAITPNKDQQTAPPTVFGASEVGTLAALMGRTGSTLRGTLLSMYSGNALGFTNKSESTYIPENSYTVGVWVGMQPDRSDELFSGKDDGLAHRLLTVEPLDPQLEDVEDGKEFSTKALDLSPVSLSRTLAETGVTFPDQVVKETVSAARDTLKYGPAKDNNGHRNQTRLKLAAGIALLSSKAEVSLGDWHRAGALMDYSDAVRERCIAHLQAQEIAAGVEKRQKEDSINAKLERDRLKKAETLIMDSLAHEEPVKRSALRDKARRFRSEFDEILTGLISDKIVTSDKQDWLRQGPRFPTKLKQAS